ncbi:MAG: hypothetical protein GY794_11780, partial [bacterium]|nr:hypothetical protein [bacterium]
QIDLLIDTGQTQYGTDSTILACDTANWDILRTGVCDAREIERIMSTMYLFVCTGNTCRSPMGEGMAIKTLCEKFDCDAKDLTDHGFCVESAGIFAFPGGRASPQSVQAMEKLGVDISKHASQKLTSELINCSDMVFCCTGQHLSEARCLAPSVSTRIRLLDPDGDIPDPIGADVSVYLDIARQMDKLFRAYLNEQEKIEKE